MAAMFRLPDHLVAKRIAKGCPQDRQGSEYQGCQVDMCRLSQVYHHHPGKDQHREDPYLSRQGPAKSFQNKEAGHDGKLPGGGDHPARGMVGTETDQPVKSSETDTSGQGPELPMGSEQNQDLDQPFRPGPDDDQGRE